MFFCRIRSREKCPKEPTCQHFLSPLHDPNGALDVEPHLETLLKGLHLLLFHSSLVDEIGILGESRILLSIVATRRDIGQPAFVPRDWSRGVPRRFPLAYLPNSRMQILTVLGEFTAFRDKTNERSCLPYKSLRLFRFSFIYSTF